MSAGEAAALRVASEAPVAAAVPALCVERITKTYTPLPFLGLGRASARRRAVHALTDISFSVEQGEMVGVLGPNGAGKTTLLKIMTTLVHPSEGRVQVMGRNINDRPRWTRKMMGLITCDERSFYWRLSGRHNLRFFATLYGVPERDAEKRMEELFDTLELTEAADRPYHSYSSGMKQKLAIARGFIASPKVLFYDEPTRSLDPLSAQRIRNWIIDQRKKSPHQTHVIATNHLHEAEQLCDRVFIIDHGRLLAQGSIPEICERWQVKDSETHTIVAGGYNRSGQWRIDAEMGLLEIAEESSGESVTVRARVARGSAALSYVLGEIIKGGGTVLRCHSERDSFEAVFFSMLNANSDAAQRRPRERGVA